MKLEILRRREDDVERDVLTFARLAEDLADILGSLVSFDFRSRFGSRLNRKDGNKRFRSGIAEKRRDVQPDRPDRQQSIVLLQVTLHSRQPPGQRGRQWLRERRPDQDGGERSQIGAGVSSSKRIKACTLPIVNVSAQSMQLASSWMVFGITSMRIGSCPTRP